MEENEPIPYYPTLAKVLHGPTLALVLTYLGIHHPAPQDSESGHSRPTNTPVLIDCDVACRDLGISRRTLHIAFSCLGAWWTDEAERSRAARAGREFLNPQHSTTPRRGYDPIKIFSVTGSKAYTTHRVLALRRNHSKLQSVLVSAGLMPEQSPFMRNVDICAPVRCVSVLAKILPVWGDRRADRWDRWRRETGKKSQNPGRMRGAKKSVGSLDCDAGYYDI